MGPCEAAYSAFEVVVKRADVLSVAGLAASALIIATEAKLPVSAVLWILPSLALISIVGYYRRE